VAERLAGLAGGIGWLWRAGLAGGIGWLWRARLARLAS